MSHETLWAPWRLNYIVNAVDKVAAEKPQTGCFLCRYRDDSHDAENYVVDRSEHSLIVLARSDQQVAVVVRKPVEHDQ